MSAKERTREKDKDSGATGTWLRKLSRRMSGEARDRSEVLELLRDAAARGVLEGDVLPMLEGVLTVGDIQVRDIMVPRAQMTVLDRDEEPDALLKTVIDSGHSRFPVMDEDKEKIVGILLAKDLLRIAAAGDGAHFDIKEFMRPPVFVPESKRLNVLLREMRRSRVHMAIVADEYGGIAGIVTLEDLIEEVLGDIRDEYDRAEVGIRTILGGDLEVDGLLNLDEFEEATGVQLPDGPYETAAGFVLQALGHLPSVGEAVEVDGVRLTVRALDGRRIERLRVSPAPQPPEPVELVAG
jgi:magnesium and cobalt transporter